MKIYYSAICLQKQSFLHLAISYGGIIAFERNYITLYNINIMKEVLKMKATDITNSIKRYSVVRSFQLQTAYNLSSATINLLKNY